MVWCNVVGTYNLAFKGILQWSQDIIHGFVVSGLEDLQLFGAIGVSASGEL